MSNRVLDNSLDLIVYCYHDRRDKHQETPPVRTINYRNGNDVRHSPRDPAQGIGHIYYGEILDDRPAGRGGGNVDKPHEDDSS